jgi:hypothetical protein
VNNVQLIVRCFPLNSSAYLNQLSGSKLISVYIHQLFLLIYIFVFIYFKLILIKHIVNHSVFILSTRYQHDKLRRETNFCFFCLI